MTDPKTTPTAADALPLPADEIHAALRGGVLRVVQGHDHEDLLQDAWVALLERLPKLEGVKPESLPAYIKRIGQRAAIDALRSQNTVRRGRRYESIPLQFKPDVPSRTPDPEAKALARVELRKAVLRAARPKTRSRGILALVLLGGLDVEVAADHLGMHPNSVYSTLSRARKRLAQSENPG